MQFKDLGTAKLAADDTDIIPIQEAGGVTRHITKENLFSGISGNSGSTIGYAQLADIKASGTNGGSYPTSTSVTRDLNTIVSSASWLSLSANVFTLEPGTYILNAIVPAIYVGVFKAWVQDANNNIILLGTPQYSSEGSPYVTTTSIIKGKIIVATETEYSIKFWAANGRSQNYVLGIAAGISGQSEIYTQVDITKVN